MTKELFYWAGGFDESFPVCEDYDLWLRIAVGHPVFLIDRPLVTKRGGYADQLSRSLWGMDRFRALAIVKLLRAGLVAKKDNGPWTHSGRRHRYLLPVRQKGASSTKPENSKRYWLNFYKEPGMTAQAIQEYALSKGFHPHVRQRWLSWDAKMGPRCLRSRSV